MGEIGGGQYGEDRILDLFFQDQGTGFLVEVGAANGRDNSNSFHLLQRPGWKGILIEPEEKQYRELYNMYRLNPRVRTLNRAIGSTPGERTLWRGGQVSTMVPSWKERCEEVHGIKYVPQTVQVSTLTEVLELFQAPSTIEFLSIDVEGMDEEVWKSLDRRKFQPKLVCLEGTGYAMDGYTPLCQTGGNTFYVLL